MKKTLAMACLIVSGAGSIAFAHSGDGGPGFGKWLERLDTNKDGKVTLAEMKSSAADLFAKADANHDGRVTQAEQDAFRQTLRGKFEQGREARVSERFAERDADKDGRLSHQEVGRMPVARFDRIDTNKDGYLSKSEFAAAKEERGEHRDQHGGKLLDRVDTNHDGSIDRAEMEAEVQRHFTHMDKNSDGVVAGDELMPRGAHGLRGRGGDHDCGPSAGSGKDAR